MKTLRWLAAALALALTQLACRDAADDAPDRSVTETIIQPAIDGILEAFDTHPLVG